MPAVVHDALDADQVLACYAVVAHEFFCMYAAEVAPLEHFLVLYGVIECDEVLRQVLRLEVLLQGRPADWAARDLGRLDVEEALFAEGVAAVQVAGHLAVSVEVLDARWALHLKLLSVSD